MDKSHQESIPSSVYDKAYYIQPEKKGGLRGSEEFDEFVKKGKLVFVFRKALKYVRLKKGQIALDIGCGRGELVCSLAKTGLEAVGIDYSNDAIKIANSVKKTLVKSYAAHAVFRRVNCTSLPFPNSYFDVVFMLDVSEHLTPKEMMKSFAEVNRVLKDKGVFVIHTPNVWFDRIGYWLIILSYHGFATFKQFPERKYNNLASHSHINCLSKNELQKALEKSGFDSRLEITVPKTFKEMKIYLQYRSPLIEFVLHRIGFFLLTTPLNYFLGTSLWARATKITKD